MTSALLTSFHYLCAGIGTGCGSGVWQRCALTGWVWFLGETVDWWSPLCHLQTGPPDHLGAGGAPGPMSQLPENKKQILNQGPQVKEADFYKFIPCCSWICSAVPQQISPLAARRQPGQAADILSKASEQSGTVRVSHSNTQAAEIKPTAHLESFLMEFGVRPLLGAAHHQHGMSF